MEQPKLTWENPPVGRRAGGSSRIDAEVSQLKKRPGRWAKLRDAAPSGNYITYRKRGVLTRVSGVGNNRYDIWGIWFGTPEEPAAVPASKLEANIVIEYPGDPERTVIVKSVDPLDDDSEKFILEVVDGRKNRRIKIAGDREVNAMGLSK